MRDLKHPEDECDVEDREALSLYRAKRTEWIAQLYEDSDHSIWKQITSMMWNDAVFRIVNESRQVANKSGEESAAQNNMLMKFIVQSYVSSQVLAVRRLTERPARDDQPQRQIISLRRLIDDLRKNRLLLTRENYVSYDGLPYDYQSIKDAFFAERMKDIREEPEFIRMPTDGPDAFYSSEDCHKAFDKLCGVSPENRRRHDRIPDLVFDQLDAWLKDSDYEKVVKYGNKFIAHAADEFSRQKVKEEHRSFTLDEIATVHRALSNVANAISGAILWEGESAIVPIPQYNVFEKLDMPWVTRDNIPKIRQFQDEHRRSVEAWRSQRPALGPMVGEAAAEDALEAEAEPEVPAET